MRILVTGGAGYVGSHTCVQLLQRGHGVVVVDNLCNGSIEALRRVEALAGARLAFHDIDIRDRSRLSRVFASRDIDAVVHCAAYKAAGESVTHPLTYFDNNVGGTINLIEATLDAGVRTFVFSSSATVYGFPKSVPITEDAPLASTNPYGRSKLMMEQVLRDVQHAHPELRVSLLRYFNPAGAHPSGYIGEAPQGTPTNLVPFVSQVAVGRRDRLKVFGNDYPTNDGTGVRDYIHVMDLADGHVAALDALLDPWGQWKDGGVMTVNLGTGRGYSVLELVTAYERACGRRIPCEYVERRPGDVAECYADPSLAARLLGWRARYGIERICADAWRWQNRNPNGYATERTAGFPAVAAGEG